MSAGEVVTLPILLSQLKALADAASPEAKQTMLAAVERLKVQRETIEAFSVTMKPRKRSQRRPGETDFREELKRSEARRKRVVRAFLALRDLKTLSPHPEPAIRGVRVRLLELPNLARDLEHEDADTIRKMLTIATGRAIEEFDARLEASDREPITPVSARYLAADQELKHGDLADE